MLSIKIKNKQINKPKQQQQQKDVVSLIHITAEFGLLRLIPWSVLHWVSLRQRQPTVILRCHVSSQRVLAGEPLVAVAANPHVHLHTIILYTSSIRKISSMKLSCMHRERERERKGWLLNTC